MQAACVTILVSDNCSVSESVIEVGAVHQILGLVVPFDKVGFLELQTQSLVDGSVLLGLSGHLVVDFWLLCCVVASQLPFLWVASSFQAVCLVLFGLGELRDKICNSKGYLFCLSLVSIQI